MGRLLDVKRITLATSIAIFVVVGIVPLCVAIVSSFSTSRGFGLENYFESLGNPRTWALFGNSFLLGSLTTAFAGVLGIGLAILFTKTDVPLRNVLTIVFSLPLLFPPYIFAVGWFEVFGYAGVVPRWFFGLPGAVLVMGSAFLPVVLLLTMTYLRTVNPALEQAGRLSSGWAVVLRRITLPLIAPGVLLSLMLVFLLAVGEFGAPSFLRLAVFPVASLTQFSAFYNFGAATAVAMPLVLIVAGGLLIEHYVLGRRDWQFRWIAGREVERIGLGGYARPLCALVMAFAVTVVAAPLLALVARGLGPGALADALDRAGASAMRSVLYSSVAASLLTILGFLIGYIVHTRYVSAWRWLDSMGLFLFTLPAAVIGIAVIGTWNHPATGWIYATPGLLMIGYVAQYTGLSTRIILAGFSQIPPSMEDAAEIAGAGWIRRIAGIVVPLSKPALVACWTVTFLFCTRDVALSLMLAPPGRDTLTARTLTLMANGKPELVAALCLLSVALAVLPLGACALVWRTWSRAR